MKKKILIVALIVVAVGAVVAVSLKRSGGQKGIPVTLAAVKSGPITGKVSGHGEVNPEALVDISANMFGQITHLAVHEGDAVTKGQLLLELDRAKFEANVQNARAAVESQKSQVELARAQNEKAQLDLKRAEDLHTRGLSSDQDLDLARTSSRVLARARHAPATVTMPALRSPWSEVLGHVGEATVMALEGQDDVLGRAVAVLCDACDHHARFVALHFDLVFLFAVEEHDNLATTPARGSRDWRFFQQMICHNRELAERIEAISSRMPLPFRSRKTRLPILPRISSKSLFRLSFAMGVRCPFWECHGMAWMTRGYLD